MSPIAILADKLWNHLFNLLERTGRVYNRPEHRNTVEVFYTAFELPALGVI